MSERTLSDELTILVCSCDAYADCWPPFFQLLRTYWPSAVPCPRILLNTESKQFSYDGLNIECLSLYPPNADVPYGRRLLDHLLRIDTPYTLLMLDDFFIRRPVDTARLKQIVDVMRADSRIAAFYFDKSVYVEPDSELLPGFFKMARYAMFKLNMQAAVWRTEKLRSYWQPGDTPWGWEVFATYTAFDTSDVFYAIDEWEHAPVYYGYRLTPWGVYRGKWVLDDVSMLFKQHGLSVDFSKLGKYNPEKVDVLFPNLGKTMLYMLHRVKLRYFLGFVCFNIYKRLLLRLGKKPRYNNHIDLLFAREQRRAVAHRGKRER